MCLRGTSYLKQIIYICRGASASARERRGVREELDQLSCELKRCRYAMQKREIEVSKRELGKYAPKLTKSGRSPADSEDMAALGTAFDIKILINLIPLGIFYPEQCLFVLQIRPNP